MNKYALAFSISNLGPKRFQHILKSFNDLEEAWEAGQNQYDKIGIVLKTYKALDDFRRTFDIEKYIIQLERNKVGFISFLDKEYPDNLKKLENPPIGLFIKGNAKLLKEKISIGVVGTRKITSYGKSVTESLVLELVDNGICIVSGLALGVDGTAHRMAVSNKGKTIAVLACGVDCCRPSENYSLYRDILKNNGLIVSEYPLSQTPNKGTFLARNRIIAALSQGVLVTEAAEDSGSLVTAQWGFRLNLKVFAVPGPITSRMSDGSLKLLKQGATLVSCGEDIVKEFKMQSRKKSSLETKNLTHEEKGIIAILENEALTIDEIARRTKSQSSKLFVLISKLELQGLIKNSAGILEVVR